VNREVKIWSDRLDKLESALRIFAKVSMFETRPSRHERHIGWQDVDGKYGVKNAEIDAALKAAREV